MAKKLKIKFRKRAGELWVDGDVLVHYACTHKDVLREQRHPGDEWSYRLHRGDAVDVVVSRVEELLFIARAKTAVLAFSDQTRKYWRHKLLPTYKGTRHGRKPLGFGKVIESLQKLYRVECVKGLEADDLLGMAMTRPKNPAVGATNDKDLTTVPGRLIDLNDSARGMQVTTPAEGFYRHMLQTVIGDRVDGYIGCPGLGDGRAPTALGDLKGRALWDRVVDLFRAAKQDEEDALRMARIAYIVRHGDYDAKTGKVKLWTPPNRPTRKQKSKKKSKRTKRTAKTRKR